MTRSARLGAVALAVAFLPPLGSAQSAADVVIECKADYASHVFKISGARLFVWNAPRFAYEDLCIPGGGFHFFDDKTSFRSGGTYSPTDCSVGSRTITYSWRHTDYDIPWQLSGRKTDMIWFVELTIERATGRASTLRTLSWPDVGEFRGPSGQYFNCEPASDPSQASNKF